MVCLHSKYNTWPKPPHSGTGVSLHTKLVISFYNLQSGVWSQYQTSWLESTGVCGVQQNQAGGSSVRKRA